MRETNTMQQYIYLIGQGENPEAAPGGQPVPSIWQSPLPIIVVLFFVWYFLVIRPGSKQREEMNKALSKLDKNDKVLTQAGIYGYVVSLKDGEDEVVIKTGDQEPASRLTISKSTIVRIFRPNDPQHAEKK
jgi:preprotein translocase subunit YajC